MSPYATDANDVGTWHRQVSQVFEEMSLEAPPLDADLFETGTLDSMAFLDLLVRLEQRFDARFPLKDLDMEQFRSVRALAGYLRACHGDALNHSGTRS